MKNKLFIITNESIFISKNNQFFCDNIDFKTIPEELNNFFDINIIGRKSSRERSKKINLKNIFIFNNIIFYLLEIFKSFKDNKNKYLIISLSHYTFFASIILKLFSKKHFIYLRSDGYEEYKSILGFFGPIIYHLMFKIGIYKSNLIACREHLLRKNYGKIVNPSQINDKWFKDLKIKNPDKTKLLYIGRLRVEKGIYSLLNILRDTKYFLTIVTAEKNVKLKEKYENVELVSFENINHTIIKFYDDHSIFILPSFTEAHPQVLDESLARCRPVIVFSEIEHVKRNRTGVFVCDRNINSLNNTINYINNNYENIMEKIKKNKLPTKKGFIEEMKNIILINYEK